MRIALMARTLDDGDGVGIANRALIDHLIVLGDDVEYLVLYRHSRHVGRYAKHAHVREVVLRAPNKLIWDQVVVPLFAAREQVDVILSPKFTVPLLTRRPSVVMCHGSEYFVFPSFYEWWDLLYVRTFHPLYYRKASRVLVPSRSVGDDLKRFLRVPYEKLLPVPLAASSLFRPPGDPEEHEAVRRRLGLPAAFVLSVARPYQGKKLYPGKNIDAVLRAFLALSASYPGLQLVLAGRDCERYVETIWGSAIARDPRLVYLGWVPREDMPHLYAAARLLAFPSYSESFGLPLVEAMACGCPVVASSGGASPEIVGDAGLIVDPHDVRALEDSIRTLLDDNAVRQRFVTAGLKRAETFNWRSSALRVLNACRDACAERSAARAETVA